MSRLTFEALRVTPLMPAKVALPIWPVTSTQLRLSFAELVGEIAARASEAWLTEKLTPPAPIMMLCPTGIGSRSVVGAAPTGAGTCEPGGGPRAQVRALI